MISRRSLFTKTLTTGGLAGLMFSNRLVGDLGRLCGLTPIQTEGPFYPEKAQEDTDWDLTTLKGASAKPLGQVIHISGVVQDENCTPVPKALVEVWQACASGRYNHSGDESGLPLDKNFQYWGRAVTDESGKYFLKTILPGHDPASPTWERPPHIHVKVYARGFHDLTTQLYFQGRSFPGEQGKLIDELNRKDSILKAVPSAERANVIIELGESPAGLEVGSKLGQLAKVYT